MGWTVTAGESVWGRRGRPGPVRLAGTLVLVLLLAAALRADAAPRIGSLLPSLTFQRAAGSTVRVPDDFRGRVLVLHFWQMGCSSCRLDIPAMDDLYGQYRGRGLEIVAVNVGQEAKAVKVYAAELGVSYPILLDPKAGSTGAYGVTDIPRTYIIDRKGVVRYRLLGSATAGTLRRLILSLL